MTREQRQAVKDLEETLKEMDAHASDSLRKEEDARTLDSLLWDTLVKFQDHPFYTAKNLEFFYIIKGNEMFVTRKDKSITRASVMMAFHKALELGRIVKGPKKLGTFGASYLYPVFREIGVIIEVRTDQS